MGQLVIRVEVMRTDATEQSQRQYACFFHFVLGRAKMQGHVVPSHIHLSLYFLKKQFWLEKDYRYAIKKNSNEKEH